MPRADAEARAGARARSVVAEGLEARQLLAVPAGFAESVVASGLTSPSALAAAPDGRIFVTLQNGAVRVVKDGVMLPTPFVTVNEDSTGERGLLGVAFDADFQTNQYVYLYYTKDDPAPLVSHNVVSRFTASGDVAVPGSEVVLFELPDVGDAIWHMGGAMNFGPDGKLYVAVGDYQQPNTSQSLSTPTGKILRINKDGSIPTDNPFFNQATGVNRAIWALGLRNPFTAAFQPGTGRFYINDVGAGSFEEVNEGAAGRNFGWPATEGTFNQAQFPNYTNPVHAYAHSQGCAVMGGAFYDGVAANFPQQYRGKYFFADFCGGWVRTIDPATRAVANFGSGFSFPVGLKLAPDGSMWVLTRGQQTGGLPNTGGLRKITYTQNQPPQIAEHPRDALAAVGEEVEFTVSAGGSPPLSYRWQSANGAGGTFADITGATSATYRLASAQVADDGARFRAIVSSPFGTVTSNEAVLRVTTNEAPVPTITAPATGTTYGGGQSFTFAGAASDAEDGALPASAFTWRVDFHHDEHSHPFVPPTTGVTSGNFTIPTTGETSDNVWYRVHLSVRDSDGLERSTFRDVLPRKATVVVESNIPGVTVLVDGQPKTTPVNIVGVEGIVRSFEAPAVQFSAGATHELIGWAHQPQAGGFEIAFPAAGGRFLALYRTVGTAYLSDMQPVGTPANGWGPYERDRSNGETASGDGRPITLGGVVYPKGLGVHANSEQVYDLGGRFKRFEAVVGVDDEVGANGSVVFELWADGTRLYQSGLLTGPMAGQAVGVDVTGRRQLRLVVTTGGDGDGYDHADWADARLFASSSPVARVNFTAPGGEAVGGYVADAGAVFADRGNGLSYGWRADVATHTRDRDAANSPDERYDSLTHLQKDGRDDVWEIAVPNGRYLVRLVGGDPGFEGDTIRLTAEGVTVASGTTTAENHWIDGRVIVVANDGNVTVRSGNGAVNNKINFAEVDRLDDAPAGPPAPTGFVATAPSDRRVDLRWEAAPGVAGYVLRRTGGPSADPAATWLLPADATAFADDALTPGTAYLYTLTAYDTRGVSSGATVDVTTPTAASVVGRHVFYNNSFFDGRDRSPSPADDGAIATDKSPLLPGQTASFANVSSYSRGINGLMVDLRGSWGDVSADDFAWEVSSDAAAPNTWSPAPQPLSVTVRPGAGAGGSDRVTVLWPDGALRNTWLRATVRSNADTGLPAPDVFYFGHLSGETGDATSDATLRVNALDRAGLRRNLAPRRPVTAASPYDLNRDGRVSASDVVALRRALRGTLTLFAAPEEDDGEPG